MKTAIKLSKWAKNNGYTYQGAYEMFARGQLPTAYRLPSGSIMIPVEEMTNKTDYTAIYCRVSTPKQKEDLERQVELVSTFCIANGWSVNKIYKEVASGLNDDRAKLNLLLDNKEITRVVVADKDRLTRFGFNYIKKFLQSRDCDLVVVNQATTDKDDLMNDFVSVITSMAARVYGLRRRKSQIKEIIDQVSKNGDNQNQ